MNVLGDVCLIGIEGRLALFGMWSTGSNPFSCLFRGVKLFSSRIFP